MSMNRRKGIKHVRSDFDESLYKFIYCNYDPEEVGMIVLDFVVGQRIRKDALLCRFQMKNNTESTQKHEIVEVRSPFDGIIESFSTQIFQKIVEAQHNSSTYKLIPQKKGNIELFMFKLCEHKPKRKQNELKNDNAISQKSTIAPLHETCQYCQQILWTYYDQAEIQICFKQFANKSIDISKVSEIQWQIILNEQFTTNTVIAKLQDTQIKIKYNGKSVFLLDFTKIKHIVNETVVMRIKKIICKHEKVKQNLCQLCLEHIDTTQMLEYRTYLFQFESENFIPVAASGNFLLHQEQQFIKRLLSQEKAIIILDLDNTILHSIEMSELEPSTIYNLKDYYMLLKMTQNENAVHKDYLIVKMRPYFKEFLYQISKLFDIYIYTKGTRVYAEQVCKYIRAQYAGEEFSSMVKTWSDQDLFLKGTDVFKSHRIISRNQDPNLDSKSLSHILPTKQQYHLVLDDRRDVWNNCKEWFFTKEYFYFIRSIKPQNYKRDFDNLLNLITKSTGSDHVNLAQQYIKSMLTTAFNAQLKQKDYLILENPKKDYFLIFTIYALQNIHKKFFSNFRQIEKHQSQKKLNLAYVHAHYKQSILVKKKIKFIIQNYQNSVVYRRALKMGMAVPKENIEEKPHIIIRANSLKNTKHKQDPKKNQQNKIQETIANQNLISQEQQISKNQAAKISNQAQVSRQIIQKIKYYSQTLSVPIVSESWIHACYQNSYGFPSQDFIIDDPLVVDVDQSKFQASVEREAMRLLELMNEKRRKC